jgi:hypothetical protein
MQSLKTISKKELYEYIENTFSDRKDNSPIGTIVTTSNYYGKDDEVSENQLIILDRKIKELF